MSDSAVRIATTKMSMFNRSLYNQEGLDYRRTKNCQVASLVQEPVNGLFFDLALDNPSGDVTECAAVGTLQLAGNLYSFITNGVLTKIDTTVGEEVFMGSACGYVNGKESPEDMIALSICYNKTTGESFIPVCLGAYGNDSAPPVEVEFGTMFESLSDATDIFNSRRQEREKANTETTVMNMQGDYAKTANTELVQLSIQPGLYQGKRVIFGSCYGSREAVPSGSWDAFVRAQVNLNNFKTAYNAATIVPVDPDHPGVILIENYYIDTVWTKFSTNDIRCSVTDAAPPEQNKTIAVKVSLSTPYEILNAGIDLVTINIPIKKIKHTFSEYKNQVETEIANYANGLGAAITTSENPYSEKGGVTSKYIIHNAKSAGSSVTAKMRVQAQVCCTQTNTDGPSYPKFIILSSLEGSFQLKSVT